MESEVKRARLARDRAQRAVSAAEYGGVGDVARARARLAAKEDALWAARRAALDTGTMPDEGGVRDGGAVVFAREARIEYQKRDTGERRLGTPVATSAVAAEHVAHAIGSPMVEHFVAIALDARLRVTGWATIGVGTISACPVDVTQIARFAVLSGAAAIVVGHNHPSGDPSPSAEDITITERIGAAMRLLGVRLLDHVIVAEGDARSGRATFSFADAGLLAATVAR